MNIAGVILAGGRSRRMGKKKAAMIVDGETMLDRMVRILFAAMPKVIVVEAFDRPVSVSDPHVLITRDEHQDQGPLEGLRMGMKKAASHANADAVFLAAVDMPFLTPAFVRHICASLQQHDVVVPRTADGIHPLASCYRTSLLPTLDEIMAGKGRRMLELIERADAHYLDAPDLQACDPKLRALTNLNTREEFEQALRLLDSEDPDRESHGAAD